MASRVSSQEDAGCFCFNLDSRLTRALPKERTKRVLRPLSLSQPVSASPKEVYLQKRYTMALWQITVKKGGNANGLKLETGMSVEVSVKTSMDPLRFGDGMDAISEAFSSKYGFDSRKFRSISMQYHLESKKIS